MKGGEQSKIRQWFFSPHLSAGLAMFLWAFSFVVIRGTHEMVPPIGLNFWRTTVAFLALFAMALPHLRRELGAVLTQWKTFLLLGFVLYITGNMAVFFGLQSTTVINGGLVNAMAPIAIVGFSWLLFRETIAPLQTLGILISLVGVVVLISRADLGVLAALNFNRGDLWFLVAVTGWSLYAVLLRRTAPALHLLVVMAALALCGWMFLLPLYIWESLTQRAMEFNAPTVLSIIYLALLSSASATLLWTRAIRMLGANRVGLFIHLMPVFSVSLAIIFLGEVLRLFHVAGISLIGIGIYLTTVLGRRLAAGKPGSNPH